MCGNTIARVKSERHTYISRRLCYFSIIRIVHFDRIIRKVQVGGELKSEGESDKVGDTVVWRSCNTMGSVFNMRLRLRLRLGMARKSFLLRAIGYSRKKRNTLGQ